VFADGTTPFSASSSTFTKVPYINPRYDDRGEFDAASNRFTASHAGDFQVCASLATGSSNPFELQLFIDGTRERAIAQGTYALEGCRTVRLKSGSTVEIWAYQASGAAIAIGNNTAWNWLTIHEQRALVSVTANSPFSAPPGTFTKVPYHGEQFDDRGEFNPTASTFTASLAGDYTFCASLFLGFDSVAAKVRLQLSLYINGARSRELFGAFISGTGCHVVRLAAGDVVDVRIYTTTSSAVAVPSDAYWSWLTVAQGASPVAISNTSTFAVPTGMLTSVPFNTELHDDWNEFDTALGRFAAKDAGDYEVCASIWDGADVSFIELHLFVNGSQEKALGAPNYTSRGCRIVRLATGDTVDVKLFQYTGSTITIQPNGVWNWLTIERL